MLKIQIVPSLLSELSNYMFHIFIYLVVTPAPVCVEQQVKIRTICKSWFNDLLYRESVSLNINQHCEYYLHRGAHKNVE